MQLLSFQMIALSRLIIKKSYELFSVKMQIEFDLSRSEASQNYSECFACQLHLGTCKEVKQTVSR